MRGRCSLPGASTQPPANDMGPEDRDAPAGAPATRHGASLRAIAGDDLINENFPLIHAVGRAAERAPRLIDLSWGEPNDPKITLIGKGVCFDTGGFVIKAQRGLVHM